MLSKKVGMFIRAVRWENGLTQKQMGELIGKSADWIRRVEQGKSAITVEQLIMILLKLGYKKLVINLEDYRRDV